jgi:limonene-1,2-epoxide hydrolase
MKTTQAWAWLTAGVLALGLNGIYRDGAAPWVHRVIEQATFRAATALAPLATQVQQFLDQVQMVAAGTDTTDRRIATGMARLQASAARAQSGIARVEAMSARRQAQCARWEANRARIAAQAARAHFANMELEDLEPIDVEVPEIHVSCPRVHVAVPRVHVVVPHVRVMNPEHVDAPGAGPV